MIFAGCHGCPPLTRPVGVSIYSGHLLFFFFFFSSLVPML